MKIALIRREFITHLDGVNKFIANLAEAFKILGHDPIIISWSFRKYGEEKLSKWFKEVHGLDLEVEVITLHGLMDKDKWVTMLLDWLVKGGRLLRRLGTDVAIVNGVVPLRFRPKIAVAHGPLINVTKIQRMVLKILYGTYDRIICISKKTVREYEGIIKCSSIIPLPLKLKSFNPRALSQRENLIVHIGTRPIKNPHISVRAVELLRERGYDVRLAIIGSMSKSVEKLCKGKGFVETIFDISENKKNDVLSGAKALILPSSGEAFPYTSLEAMACGTPPVVSYAVPDDVVVHMYNGLMVKSLDPLDYANSLESLLRNEELWLSLSRNALKYVRSFDYLEIANRYLKVIEKIIKPNSVELTRE